MQGRMRNDVHFAFWKEQFLIIFAFSIKQNGPID